MLVDIETAPAKVYSWGVYDQNISINQIIEYPYLMCWSAKWLGEKKVFWDTQINYPEFKKDNTNDFGVARSIWKLLDECDIAIAHNGDQFDFKRLNSYFIKNGMMPPSPYKTIDTKKASKGNFGFISNKLDSLCRELEIGAKMEHEGMALWTKCMAGNKSAWERMVRYNKKDVLLLEKLYLELRPFIKSHPNVGVSKNGGLVCPRCSSTRVNKRGLEKKTTFAYQRYMCRNCFGNFHGEAVSRIAKVAVKTL